MTYPDFQKMLKSYHWCPGASYLFPLATPPTDRVVVGYFHLQSDGGAQEFALPSDMFDFNLVERGLTRKDYGAPVDPDSKSCGELIVDLPSDDFETSCGTPGCQSPECYRRTRIRYVFDRNVYGNRELSALRLSVGKFTGSKYPLSTPPYVP